MRLNLGCGNKIMEGFVNIDAVQHDGVDLILDLSEYEVPFEGVDYINCQDFLEHLYKNKQLWFLESCYKKLKTGGKIYIQIPDLEILAKRYCGVLENPSNMQHDIDGKQLASSLYGGSGMWDSHKWGYDKYTLREILESIGFIIESIGSDGGQNLLCLARK